MNERSKTSSAKSGVLEKHDTLQAVQAPTPRVLTVAVKRSMHSMLQGQSDAGPAQKPTRRGFSAKRATIKRG
jgi:hypothetical protein